MSDPAWSFTLVARSPALDEDLSSTLQARLPNAIIAGHGGLDPIGLDVDRPAASLVVAVTSAIADAESVAGVVVEQVEPVGLVSASEIARRSGRSRQSISQLVAGTRGPGDFPRPYRRLGRSDPTWKWEVVEAWLDRGSPADVPQLGVAEEESILLAINAALAMRNIAPDLPDADTRRHIRTLLGADVLAG